VTLAITWYQWFLAAHIVAAALWLGGGTTLIALSVAARKQGDPAKEVDLVRFAGRIGGPVYGLAAWVLLGFGIGLVENGASPWSFDNFFVQFGLGAWLFSGLVGGLYYGHELKGIEAAAERGPADPEVRMRLQRYYRVGTLDSLVLLAAVFVMSTKPFL
jgi:uncharacterized membrane protein